MESETKMGCGKQFYPDGGVDGLLIQVDGSNLLKVNQVGIVIVVVISSLLCPHESYSTTFNDIVQSSEERF